MNMGCEHRHWGLKKLVLGALLLLNAFVWPKWGVEAVTAGKALSGWISFLALLMVISGFLMLVKSRSCCSGNGSMPKMATVKKKPAKKATKKKRK